MNFVKKWKLQWNEIDDLSVAFCLNFVKNENENGKCKKDEKLQSKMKMTRFECSFLFEFSKKMKMKIENVKTMKIYHEKWKWHELSVVFCPNLVKKWKWQMQNVKTMKIYSEKWKWHDLSVVFVRI